MLFIHTCCTYICTVQEGGGETYLAFFEFQEFFLYDFALLRLPLHKAVRILFFRTFLSHHTQLFFYFQKPNHHFSLCHLRKKKRYEKSRK